MSSREALDDVLALAPGPIRTAAVAAWFQSLYPARLESPVLVGGAALELYTRGAYTTGDFDFVGDVPREIEEQLRAVGFERKARHWVHGEGRIFIELPAKSFDQETRVDTVRISGRSVLLIAPEDLLIDRLAAWSVWKVPVEGINAFLLWRDRGAEMDADRLERLAGKAGLRSALDSLLSFATRWRETDPKIEEVERWAQEMR